MKITELHEGAEPKLPGAVSGIKIITPQQFVVQADDDEHEGVAEGKGIIGNLYSGLKSILGKVLGKKVSKNAFDQIEFQRMMSKITAPVDTTQYSRLWQEYKSNPHFYVTTPTENDLANNEKMFLWANSISQFIMNKFPDASKEALMQAARALAKLGAEESKEKRRDVDEATKLPADQREFGGQEFQDYMTRIKGTDDIDKKTGQVKVDKKGIPKYTTGKTKSDKYKMPYMHRSSVIEYYSEEGKRYKEEAVIDALKQRPKKLLKQNEKMKHSNGELEQFFNVGFAALTGIAVDESTDKLIIVNTCPGAGSCKVDCFAMKGGKVQFKAAWLSDGRILTYLLNDPDGFFNQLSSEIAKEEKLGDKGGYEVTIRWHDAGDFFSPEYFNLAMEMAKKHPGVKFYAYTKISDAALADKPGNFLINWSEGAHTSQEKKVKSSDPRLMKTKNSRIVPTDTFDDLLVKDKKGNLVKGPDGQWQIQPDKLSELKQRLAKLYDISRSSILSYDEYLNKPKIANMKYNVIVAPGEGDISANDKDVISTLLLKH